MPVEACHLSAGVGFLQDTGFKLQLAPPQLLVVVVLCLNHTGIMGDAALNQRQFALNG